jgi:two-component system OmpR family sensor kinase
MSRLPIRVRLALYFALAMAIVFAGAGWFAYARVSTDLRLALDDALRGRAQDLSALVADGGSVRATEGSLIESGESFAEVLDPRGSVLDATRPIARSLLSQEELAAAQRGPVFANRPLVPGLDEPARLLALPVSQHGERVVLVVGATRENRAETLSSLRTSFLIGGPIALVLAALGGYLLAGAALRPIESMRRRAAEISTTSLDERLPVPDANDEVARLGETLNAMLARLEDGLERERRFLADASHELRTPLALLKTELGLALKPGRTEEELRAAIGSAAEQTDRLARIADDLLLLARAEQGELRLKTERLDVIDLLHDVARRFEPRSASNGRAVSVAAGDPLVVTADRLRLEQALTNLVDNAVRHGRGAITVSACARNGSAELHVVDEGGGFDDAFLGRAFERFTQADAAREGEGSGLGLAIVATIARAHHGSAQAANLSGGGADVWISVPTE